MLHFVKEQNLNLLLEKKNNLKLKEGLEAFTLVNSVADGVEYFLKIMNFYVRLIQILKMKLNWFK